MLREAELSGYKIVTTGGGTGHWAVLNGIKKINDPNLITAIPGFTDDGGGSGKLISSFGVLPPGDARRCLLALLEEGRQLQLTSLFNFRFPEGLEEAGPLAGQNVGNLVISALELMYGSQNDALYALKQLLNSPGRVIPISQNRSTLHAVLSNDDDIRGESAIDLRAKGENFNPDDRIKYIYLDEPAYLHPSAKEAIEDADYVIISPGDLYTSILPLFLVNGFTNALTLTRAKIVYCGNLITKQGETDGFKASDCLREIKKYLGDRVIDFAILNENGYWPGEANEVLDAYKREGKHPIVTDLKACRKFCPNAHFITSKLAKYFPAQRVVRHDSDELGKSVKGVFSLVP